MYPKIIQIYQTNLDESPGDNYNSLKTVEIQPPELAETGQNASAPATKPNVKVIFIANNSFTLFFFVSYGNSYYSTKIQGILCVFLIFDHLIIVETAFCRNLSIFVVVIIASTNNEDS